MQKTRFVAAALLALAAGCGEETAKDRTGASEKPRPVSTTEPEKPLPEIPPPTKSYEPTPAPTPAPEPVTPAPAPEPKPDPMPEPKPEPAPEPKGDPAPAPVPAPVPEQPK